MTRLLSGVLALAALAVVGACGGDGPATCGVAGATQSCVCPSGATAGQTCQVDGSWSVCGCVDPVCEGVTCDHGGACVAEGGAAMCDCPAGTFGAGCGGVCEAEPIPLNACSASLASDRWYTKFNGTQLCFLRRAFAVDAPGAGRVDLIIQTDYGATAPYQHPTVPMSDDDGDGRWEVPLLLTEGKRWIYVFDVDGSQRLDPGVPTDPDTGGSLIETPACEALPSGALPCTGLLGDGDVTVSCASGGPDCADDGGADDGGVDAWFGVVLPWRRVVTQLRFRSDWWQKRPTTWELWASDDPAQVPGAGARLVGSGDGHAPPWECVSGEPCDDPAVPDACCPDGRTSPQRVPADGHIAKWDVHPVDGAGKYFFLRVVGTQDGETLILDDIALDGHDCFTTGGTFPQPACAVGGVGVDAGCRDGEWCAPGAGPDAASPGCTTVGTSAAPDLCARVRCDDPAAPSCPTLDLCPAGELCLDGASYRSCAAVCDPAGADTCGPARACTPATSGDASLPFGTCQAVPCDRPFGAGACGPGAWCVPESETSGVCQASGSGATGDSCEAGCAANHICAGPRCDLLCATDGTFPDAPSCAGTDVCVGLLPGLGVCRQTCEFDVAGTCPAASFCQPPEMSGLDAAVCQDTPSSWPDDGGVAIGATCSASQCGPLATCYGNDADGDGQVDGQLCVARCRTAIAPFGTGHPDCPSTFPNCSDVAGDPGLGACLP